MGALSSTSYMWESSPVYSTCGSLVQYIVHVGIPSNISYMWNPRPLYRTCKFRPVYRTCGIPVQYIVNAGDLFIISCMQGPVQFVIYVGSLPIISHIWDPRPLYRINWIPIHSIAYMGSLFIISHIWDPRPLYRIYGIYVQYIVHGEAPNKILHVWKCSYSSFKMFSVFRITQKIHIISATNLFSWSLVPDYPFRQQRAPPDDVVSRQVTSTVYLYRRLGRRS